MESYSTKMNPRPDLFEPAGSYRKGFSFRVFWNEMPMGAAALLYEAVLSNHTENCLLALRRGADPNVFDPIGSPLLHHAVRHLNLEMIDALVRFGANVNIQDRKAHTALHICAESPVYLEIMRWLLEMGCADATIRDFYGITAMDIALEKNNTQAVELIEHMTEE